MKLLCQKFTNKLERFLPGKPLQPSQMFVVKALAYPFMCSTLGLAPGLKQKHLTRLERPAGDKL